jgi:hypothetical protein
MGELTARKRDGTDRISVAVQYPVGVGACLIMEDTFHFAVHPLEPSGTVIVVIVGAGPDQWQPAPPVEFPAPGPASQRP